MKHINSFLLILCLMCTASLLDAARPHRKYPSGMRIKGLKKNNKILENDGKGAKIIKSSHFDYDFELGHKIVLICVAMGSPMPRITWFKDGIELYNHPYLQSKLHTHRSGYHNIGDYGTRRVVRAAGSYFRYLLGRYQKHPYNSPAKIFNWFDHTRKKISEWRLGESRIKAKMEITPARQMDIGTYECQANNKHRVDRKVFVADYTTAFI